VSTNPSGLLTFTAACLFAWLFITARNRCISELRKKQPSIISVEAIADLSSRAKTPEESASEEERLLAIHDALEQLMEPYKQTILQSLQGDPLEEIALTHRISIALSSPPIPRKGKMKLLLRDAGGNDYGQL